MKMSCFLLRLLSCVIGGLLLVGVTSCRSKKNNPPDGYLYCKSCDGTGKAVVPIVDCAKCDGTGWVKIPGKKIKVPKIIVEPDKDDEDNVIGPGDDDIIDTEHDLEWEDCWVCHGSQQCDQCNGSGISEVTNMYGEVVTTQKCGGCNGTGICRACSGTGGRYVRTF